MEDGSGIGRWSVDQEKHEKCLKEQLALRLDLGHTSNQLIDRSLTM